jgi:hypothetical protein
LLLSAFADGLSASFLAFFFGLILSWSWGHIYIVIKISMQNLTDEFVFFVFSELFV